MVQKERAGKNRILGPGWTDVGTSYTLRRTKQRSKRNTSGPQRRRGRSFIIYFFTLLWPIGIFRKLFSTQTIFINIFPTPIYRLLPIKAVRPYRRYTDKVVAERHNIIVVHNDTCYLLRVRQRRQEVTVETSESAGVFHPASYCSLRARFTPRHSFCSQKTVYPHPPTTHRTGF